MEISEWMKHVESMEVHSTSSTYIETADNITSRNGLALTQKQNNL